MISLPIRVNKTEYDLVLVLEDENIERIKQYDPAEYRIFSMCEPWLSQLKLRKIVIGYLMPSDMKMAMKRLSDERSPSWLLKKIASGFKYRPELGDDDSSYQQPLNQ